MNKLVILIMLSFSLNTFAQEILFPETEIIFHTRGATNTTVTTFEVKPLLYDNFYPMAIYSQNKFDRCNLDLKLLPLQSIDLTQNFSGKYYFNLSKNYPNPFNPTTKINFQIPEDGIVELKVYDINGNELKILLNEFISAGEYTLDFNATDLPSGIYFYRIKYKEYVETRQMVLLK